jgi:uncharacterized membrane protein YkoI
MPAAISNVMRAPIQTLGMLLLAGALFVAGAGGALSDDDQDEARDHELARKALVEGRIRSLAEITEAFKAQMAGEIVGVELETEVPGVFVYEFKILTPEGKLKEVDVDAATAKILSVEDE